MKKTASLLMAMLLFALNVRAESTQAGVFDFETRTVRLNSGYTMPIMGLGTYALDHDTCVNSVMTLLESGGRLIDTAYMYGNEEAVGEGVRRAWPNTASPGRTSSSSPKSTPASSAIPRQPSIWRFKSWTSDTST